jgi:N-acetylmuramoyl-L-alanine amidase
VSRSIARHLPAWRRGCVAALVASLVLCFIPHSSVAQSAAPEIPGERVPVVVLDPGHGGSDQGAQGPGGLQEKEITLQLATEAARLIEQLLGLRTVLTRTDDSALPLEKRAAVANQAKGDLFISIHVGGAFTPTPRDFQTFFFDDLQGISSASADDARPQKLLARGGQGQLGAGPGGQIVLWEHTQVEFLEPSQIFARLLHKTLRAQVAAEGHGVFGLPLLVLRWVRMPAVMLDLGSLSDPGFEAKLRDETYIQRAALGIAQAVNDYHAMLR